MRVLRFTEVFRLWLVARRSHGFAGRGGSQPNPRDWDSDEDNSWTPYFVGYRIR